MSQLDHAVDIRSLFDLTGEVAVVTGASSGLGERFARVLHAAGAVVILAARRTDRIEAVARSLGDGRALAVGCDITSEADRERLMAVAAGSATGGPTVLINNAGRSNPVPAEEETPSDFANVVDVNLTATFLLTQLVGRAMLAAGRGSIISITSIYGQGGAAPLTQASYCASKAALGNLTRELACQWGSRGVRVNAIAPGWFSTEMTAAAMGDDDTVAYIRRNTPMRRIGGPEELDGAVLYLASAASAYCTGQVLAVDGGWTAR